MIKSCLHFYQIFQYWTKTKHPIISILKTHLNAFDEYPVENFHSLVRRKTNAKVLSPECLRYDGIFNIMMIILPKFLKLKDRILIQNKILI